MKKIDIHVHAVIKKGICYIGSDKSLATPEEILAIYHRQGIGQGVLQPLVSNECQARVVSNEETMDIVDRFPETFFWFCNVDPRMGLNSAKTDLSYFLGYYKERGARGVGEVAINRYFDDPFVENLFSHCQKNNLPLLFHSSTQEGESYGLIDDYGMPRLEKALMKYPDLALIGHAPPFWSAIDGALTKEHWTDWYYPNEKVVEGRLSQLLRKYPNLYGDISAGSGGNAMMRDPDFTYDFMEEFQDRLLFGTDICDELFDMGTSAFLDDAAARGKISQTAYRKICRGNALRLMGIPEE